jgi:endonuclease YncB( thermonuclease family)
VVGGRETVAGGPDRRYTSVCAGRAGTGRPDSACCGRGAIAAHPVFALLLGLALAGQPSAPPVPPEPSAPPPGGPVVSPAEDAVLIEALVTRVVDAGTLEARVFGNRTGVGYLGVWTPAVTQPCGPEAETRSRELAGARVLLEEDSSYQFDGAGRRLYYAYTPEGTSIDAALVREGLALAVRGDARHGAALAALQAEAEAAARGCLWAGA